MIETNAEITHARLAELFPNPYQPQSRLEVKEAVAKEFGESILEKGLLQIPVVRAVYKGNSIIQLQMVDGWLRRSGFVWLVAHGHPEYDRMPIVIRPFTDQQMADMIYVANRERKDLTPIDLAWYYKKYLAEFKGITQAKFAETLKISQSEIANTMRLLDLPEEVQDMIIAHEISESHGRALLPLKESDLMLAYAQDAVKNAWPVATLDGVVKTYLDSRKPKLVVTPPPPPPPPPKSEVINEEETEGDETFDKRKCRVCGCTDDNACMVNGVVCHWVEEDLCSFCAQKAGALVQPENQSIPAGVETEAGEETEEGPVDESVPVTWQFMVEVNKTYSAQAIAEGKPIKKPFAFLGKNYVSIGGHGIPGRPGEICYQVIEKEAFSGKALPYKEHNKDESTLNNPNGSYHSMLVKYDKRDYVLSGPPITFYQGETAKKVAEKKTPPPAPKTMPKLNKPEPVKTTPPPSPPKPAWKRKLVLEEKGDKISVGYCKVGGIPKFAIIEGNLESLLGVPDSSPVFFGLKNFIEITNAEWENAETKLGIKEGK